MAFGDVLHTGENTGTDNASPFTLAQTITSPTSGSLLVFEITVTPIGAFGGFNDPAGWNSGNLNSAGLLWSKTYWKISDGTETTVTGSVSGDAGTASLRTAYVEYEGPFTASPFDVGAEDESNNNTAVSSCATGTTAATAQNDELAVAVWAGQRASFIDATASYTNSFVEDIFASRATSTARPCCIIAHKVLSATGTQTCTFSCTDTGCGMYGQILTFKKDTGTTGFNKLAGEGGGAVGIPKRLVA